jgi:hypothetical protein
VLSVVIVPPLAVTAPAKKLMFPVPAVIVVTLLLETVEVVPVKPAPNVIPNVDG